MFLLTKLKDNVKQYTPPLKDKVEEENEVAIFDTPEKNKIKKKSSSLPSNGSDTLVLENIVEGAINFR